jgi:hypothetical protein
MAPLVARAAAAIPDNPAEFSELQNIGTKYIASWSKQISWRRDCITGVRREVSPWLFLRDR